MLPVKPKTTEEHKERYAKAVERIFDPLAITSSDDDRPGKNEDCIFDWSDGLRIIISKEVFPSVNEPLVHMSASVSEDSPIGEHIRVLGAGERSLRWFMDFAYRRFQEISGGQKLMFLGLSPNLIPHWMEEPLGGFPQEASEDDSEFGNNYEIK